jgi:hypothetical protein
MELRGEKDKHCDPEVEEDKNKGSQWDHVGLEAETKLAISSVVGLRIAENTVKLIKDVAERTNHEVSRLITSDEYKPYREKILKEYGETVTPQHTGKRGRPRKAFKVPPPDLAYATVHKHRRKGRVSKITVGAVFGSMEEVKKAISESRVSHHVNITFVERYNATTRQHNARKQRKVYTFSKDLFYHEAESWSRLCFYNFVRVHGGLRLKKEDGRQRTPAIAAGLTNHVWSLPELICYPVPYPSIRSSS